jgi:alcohol dehydrogenase (NADP+)
MEHVLDLGLVKSIGVSNFPVMLLHELLSRCTVPPAVNQCESHPYLQQTALLRYCQKRGVRFEAYSPLGTPGYAGPNEPAVLDDPVLTRIAATHAHGVSVSQVCLAWALQRGTSVVVKSASAVHQAENIRHAAASDAALRLSDLEMEQIASIDLGHRFFRPEDWWGELGMAVFN